MSAVDASDPLVARMRPFGTTIFAEMSALAARTGAVNLGQGFPDYDGPASMLSVAADAIRDGVNQYPPGPGTAELRHAVAEHQRRFWGLDLDPESEVVVTAGATEAVTAAILALCEAGDEVVCFDPLYDSYAAAVALAGATLRPVTLRPSGDPGVSSGDDGGDGHGGGSGDDPGVSGDDLGVIGDGGSGGSDGGRGAGDGDAGTAGSGPGAGGGFGFDPAELRTAVGARTRLLLLNSPHNPTGKVFRREELELVARLCVEHDLVAVTDEVYEHLTFDRPHVPLATLPGMRERTVTISSAGKTFSCTGWKIGWACGPAPLVGALLRVKQYLTFTNGAPFQPAVAHALALPDDYVRELAATLRSRRDRLSAGLVAAGLDVLPSEGTYFVAADVRPLAGGGGRGGRRGLGGSDGLGGVDGVGGSGGLGGVDGVEFCRQLPERCGVVAVPMQVFYADPVQGRHLVRFTFGKSDAVLDEAISRLARLRKHLGAG